MPQWYRPAKVKHGVKVDGKFVEPTDDSLYLVQRRELDTEYFKNEEVLAFGVQDGVLVIRVKKGRESHDTRFYPLTEIIVAVHEGPSDDYIKAHNDWFKQENGVDFETFHEMQHKAFETLMEQGKDPRDWMSSDEDGN